jgi:hypothetical protein
MHIENFKNEGWKLKQVLSGSGYQWEVGGHKENVMEGSMVDVFLYSCIEIE